VFSLGLYGTENQGNESTTLSGERLALPTASCFAAPPSVTVTIWA
jgi:hypothetical protein